ncbi:hypothetical protein EXIGLDRAFT_842178 [Exidia glandulosa HHB12029]|uniref:Uncharacterized protein n=1 Tax=Exidia glandulosa HHB12029 TaxID=1314781 RepID=A0A165DFR8_EXIGL|nr:hypothetical protein EXIGLDRAFT_842178 [Exidia glandulosa HHB12029]
MHVVRQPSAVQFVCDPVLIAVAVAAVLVNAQQQHVFETTNVGEYEDDLADWYKKWSTIKHAGRPTSVAYPPAMPSTPSVAFPKPTGFAGSVAQGDEAIAAMESSAYPPPQHGPVVASMRTRDAKKNFDAPSAWGNLSRYNSLSPIPSNSNFPPTSPAIPRFGSVRTSWSAWSSPAECYIKGAPIVGRWSLRCESASSPSVPSPSST